MLEFFNDDALRELIDRKEFGPFDVDPLDHTMESLPLYQTMWEEVLKPYYEELNVKVLENPYLSVIERQDMNTLGSVKGILAHLVDTVEFAKDTNQLDQLLERFKYLEEYATKETKCTFYKDFAPYSFGFVMARKLADEEEYTPWFNGGLIYHGTHDKGGDGGAPTFSVNLTPQHGWSVHT